MALPSVGTPSYSQSALRYGLMDIKPIQVVETVKRYGLKFRRITRGFESLKPSQSFEDLVTFNNELIFNTIEVPDWCEPEKLVKVSSQRSIELYHKDTEFKDAVEKLKKSERIGRPLLSFVQFMKNRFESHRQSFLEEEAGRFLNSNFPLYFYSKLVVFQNTYYDLLKIMEDIVRRYEFHATYSRSFDMYNKIIAQMKGTLRPLLDQIDVCFFSSSCVERYVNVWNAKSYEEIFDPPYLDIGKVDYSKLEQLSNDFKKKLTETRELLLSYDSRILSRELNPEDPTTRMFSKVIMLPSESLDIER